MMTSRILLVEDEPGVRLTVLDRLKSEGYAVECAVDGDEGSRVDDAVRDLAMIGLDHVAGYWGAEAIRDWSAAGGSLSRVPQLTVKQLATQLANDEVTVVDVRGRAEWEAGHIAGVANIPVGYLADRLNEIPPHAPVVVHCQSGARSAIAASVLRAHGLTNVGNVVGGFAAWLSAGEPVERGKPAGAHAGV